MMALGSLSVHGLLGPQFPSHPLGACAIEHQACHSYLGLPLDTCHLSG